jgi:hypothetical protein
VTLRTAAVALDGTPKAPATLMSEVPPAFIGLPKLRGPLHCLAAPPSMEGSEALVSQMRTGVNGLYGPVTGVTVGLACPKTLLPVRVVVVSA